MMNPAAGTAAPEAITPLMKARREVGLRAKPVSIPTAETAPVSDPSPSDMAVSPYARQAVARLSQRPHERQSPSPRKRGIFAGFYRTDPGAAQGARLRSVALGVPAHFSTMTCPYIHGCGVQM